MFHLFLLFNRYRIDHNNSDPLYNFEMNPDSGVVTIRKPLDRETTSSFSLIVLAIDKGKKHVHLWRTVFKTAYV